MRILGIASVLTVIVVFAIMAGCRTKTEAETVKQQEFFTDRTLLMGCHQNKHLECLGEIYAFAKMLVKMERTEHPIFTKPDAYYLACMRAKGMVF